jgi:hypothetical protein
LRKHALGLGIQRCDGIRVFYKGEPCLGAGEISRRRVGCRNGGAVLILEVDAQ